MSPVSPSAKTRRKRLLVYASAVVFASLIVLGVFAKNDWLPTRSGKSVARNSSGGNPLAPAAPSPTPQLTKSYVYAGSRLLAIEDANANASPPYDLAIWRPSTGTWWVLGGPGSQSTSYQWGAYGDKAVPGDFDGDGKTDFSIYRPSTGYWWITKSSDGSTAATSFGQSADIPAPADYS